MVAFAAAATGVPAGPSGAQGQALSGGAYGHFTTVSLFGGPPGPNGPAPQVTLPPNGTDTPLTGEEASASAVYGPAKIFGGRSDDKLAANPGSGPIKVSTEGKPGAGGYVTSTASIVLHPKPVPVQCQGEPPGSTNCQAVGGFGPSPPTEGDELHSTCTADASGATGSTRIVKGVIATATDPDGAPINIEPLPDNPPPNYTRQGQLTNVGDNYRIVYNEQIKEGDRSITVNAVHMYLLGPIALGEQILGQVKCSAAGVTAGPRQAQAPASTSPTTGATTSSSGDDDGTSILPIAAAVGGVVLLGAVLIALAVRRRRKSAGEQWLDSP